MARHVLVVDDDLSILASLSAALADHGLRVSTARSAAQALAVADADPPDAVLLDLYLGTESGLDVLVELRRRVEEPPPVIMISGQGTIGDAVKALTLGAIDFMEKPLGGAEVLHRVHRALRDTQLRTANRRLVDALGGAGGLVGQSPAIARVHETIALVAPTDARVLVTGESGTGKELVARAIHLASPRAEEPFVAVNCSAIPRDLVESELFGHQKGAFTGATTTRRGAFEQASGGTLFLDEVGDMPLAAQPKLLRALEEGRIQRVGAESTLPVDVRVIAATHRDLAGAARRGEFREDLYHRLDVVELALPPLRERGGDVVLLARHFLARFAERHGRAVPELTPDACDALERLPFPGNVRELRNLMERITILTRTSPVSADTIRALGGASAAPGGDEPWEPPALADGEHALRDTMRRVERELVRRAVDEAPSMIEAARRLGLERSHLYKKMRELDLER
jgi:two-component system nitrogen regulation response regulator NtrX